MEMGVRVGGSWIKNFDTGVWVRRIGERMVCGVEGDVWLGERVS